MRWPAAVFTLLLPSCAFEMPREPSARERCYEYAAELDRKMVECGDSPADREAFNARNLAKCDRVVLLHPLHDSEQCIEDVRRIDCARRNTETWCSAFVEAGPR